MPLGLILHTVSSVYTHDGRGNASGMNYTYEGGLWSSSERRFLGFRKATAVVDAQGNYTETYYLQEEGSISKPEFTYFKDSAGQIFSYSHFQYTGNYSPPYTSLLTDRADVECNLSANCRTVLVQFAYDQYGNALTTLEHGDLFLGGDERFTLRGYAPNTAAYIVGLPAYENVYKGFNTSGALLQSVRYYYDGAANYITPPTVGALTEVRKWDSQTGGFVTSQMGYDAWGNITSETDERGYQATITYDPVYHVYPIAAVNGLGQSTTRQWDYVLGLETSSVDANNAVTQTTYDRFGRRETLTFPDGSVTTFQYIGWGYPHSQHILETKPDGSADGLWKKTFQDGLGRVYKTVKEGDIVQEIRYTGASKRIFQKSLPYGPGETPRWATYAYDGPKRMRTMTLPDGNFAEIVYGNDANGKPYEIHYDELGHERTIWKDAYGNIAEIREKNGAAYYHTTYEHDVLNRLVRAVDALGNVSLFTWDSLGRRLSSNDPDMGYWTYRYDSGGNLTAQTDAKGQTVYFEYDPLNRMTHKRYPDGSQVEWRYDEPGHGAGVGRLTSVSYPGGSESYVWDVRGLKVEELRCVTGVCQTLGYAYDALGRQDTIVYPDGETVTHGYNGQGRLTSVSGYVDNIIWNTAGQPLEVHYANGVVSQFDYDPDRQWLDQAETLRGGAKLYHAQYIYDAAARVMSAKSNTNPLLNLSYDYDDLDRLIGVTKGQTQSFAYDAIGNMTYNSNVGVYQYNDPAHVHAATVAGGASYQYDANGAMTRGAGRQMTWDYDNRLTSLTRGGNVTEYLYDAGESRVQKSDGKSTIRYFGPRVELETQSQDEDMGALRQFYYAGPMLVARKDASGTVWHHADHLDSIRLTTDAGGQVVTRYDYDAFGQIISQTGPSGDAHGFNGHEHDPESGLVYMQARYYDPVLCRFLSPDIIAPDPANPQSLNRYSFVFNNPISNKDPTGHAPVVAAVISAVVITAKASTLLAVTAWVGAGLSIAGYYAEDPVLSSIGSLLLGFAGGYASPGPLSPTAGGILGAGSAAATSPISPLDPGVKEAVGWTFSAFGSISDGQSAVQFALYKGANVAAELGISKLAKEIGVDPGELNAALTIVSFIGNEVAGSRLRERKKYVGILGVSGRKHAALGVPFDIVDIVLGYQGLPTATAYEYMFSANKQLPLLGHSLGGLDANNLAGLGVAGKDVTAAALPAFNGGAPGVNVLFGNGDAVNGFVLFGAIFNPFGEARSTSFLGHSATFYGPEIPSGFYDP